MPKTNKQTSMRHCWNDNCRLLIFERLEGNSRGRSLIAWGNMLRHQAVGRELCMLGMSCGGFVIQLGRIGEGGGGKKKKKMMMMTVDLNLDVQVTHTLKRTIFLIVFLVDAIWDLTDIIRNFCTIQLTLTYSCLAK